MLCNDEYAVKLIAFSVHDDTRGGINPLNSAEYPSICVEDMIEKQENIGFCHRGKKRRISKKLCHLPLCIIPLRIPNRLHLFPEHAVAVCNLVLIKSSG
jgi:hypothetical protein